MNTKKLVLSIVAAFLFIFVFDWIFHGPVLGGIYRETMELWRTEEQMGEYLAWIFFGQLVVAVMLCLIFATCFRAHNVASGVLLGMLVAGINAGGTFITYAVQPIPSKLMALWIVGGLIELAIVGAIVGAIYRPLPRAA